ncbi:MAG: GHKL domain-containing protein [Balneolaceae bacterium]|nr:GHKL domain-containing protein [Balneolaceae bacterium]
MNKYNEYVVQVLQSLDAFSNVPADQLSWLVENSKVCTYQPDEHLAKPGDEIDRMLIFLDGEVKIELKQGKQLLKLGNFKTGDVSGKLPFSRMQSSVGYLTVVDETTLLETHESIFPEIAKRYELIEAFVHQLSDRIRSFTNQQVQNEKLVALGKLSAGLAHELNNPASAMVRSATALRDNIRAKPDKFKAIMHIKLTDQQVDAINELVFRKAGGGSTNNQSLMERTALEDELTDWMDDHNIELGFEYAPTFAEFCFSVEDLEFVKAHLSEEPLASVLGWIEDVLTTEKMVEEIEDASRRISELVSSVKTYSHMDRGSDKEAVDIKKMLKSTLTMLNHKAKVKNLTVDVNVEKDLPEFCGYVSELNQVWTNIIDNAIDAVDEGGNLRIHVSAKNGDIEFVFQDDGPGIPADIQSQIFDPFFTTKDVGKGTGLGLDVVRKIVEKHEGRIELNSKPGNTQFKLTFPQK